MILQFYINLHTERRGRGNLLWFNLIKSKAPLTCSHPGLFAHRCPRGSVMPCFLLTNAQP